MLVLPHEVGVFPGKVSKVSQFCFVLFCAADLGCCVLFWSICDPDAYVCMHACICGLCLFSHVFCRDYTCNLIF